MVDKRELALGQKIAKVSQGAVDAVRRHWPRPWNGAVMVVAMSEPRVMATAVDLRLGLRLDHRREGGHAVRRRADRAEDDDAGEQPDRGEPGGPQASSTKTCWCTR